MTESNHGVFSQVLVVGFEHDPPRGGQGVYLRELVAHAPGARLLQGVWRAPRGRLAFLLGPVFFFKHLWFSFRLQFILPAYIRRFNIRVVHLQTGPSGVFLLRRLPVRVVATAHHTYSLSWRYKRTMYNALYYLWMGWLERQTLSRCDQVLAISDFMRQELITYSHVPADRLRVLAIPPADRFRPLHIKKKNFLLFVGRMERQKSLKVILAAMRDPMMTTPLVAVGSDAGAIRSMVAADPILRSKVEVRGQVTQDELVVLYNQARLCLMPSLFEALGLVALESLACGTPCLVGKSTGAAEIIQKFDPTLILPTIDPPTIKQAILYQLANPHSLPPLNLRWKRYMEEYQKLIANF